MITHQIDRGDELGQALEGVVLALEGDQHGVRGRECIDGEETERGRAIDEDVVEPVCDR